MNLHKEQNEDSIDLYVDNAIDKMHGEIEAAIRQQFLTQHAILDCQLSCHDLQEIKARAEIYCSNVKKALKKTEFSAQVTQLSNTIDSMFVESISADSPVGASIVNKNDARKLAIFIDRREKRQQIAALNPKILSERDKYVLIHYLNQTYPDHPQYVDSVRDHLMQERKMGPLAETFKILLAYPSSSMRALFAILRTTRFLLFGIAYWALGNQERLDETRIIVRSTVLPIKELLRKLKNDIGLVAKGLAGLLRIGWGVIAGILFMPITLLSLLPTLIVKGKFSVKVFSTINEILFAPGRVSSFINMIVGMMRSDSGSKDLQIITRDMDIHYNRKILNPVSIQAELLNSNAETNPTEHVEPEILEALVLDMMKSTLEKYSTLRKFTLPRFATFKEITDALSHAITHVTHYTKTSRFFEPNPAVKNDLHSALIIMVDKIKKHPDISFQSSMHYQKTLMQLIQANKRDPIFECKKAYEKFTSFVMPTRPGNSDLHAVYDKLKAAQTALLRLKVNNSDLKARSAAVVDLLNQHDCLSLQSVREISRLKKTISFMKQFEQHNKVLSQDSQIPVAKKLLLAFELIHASARTASYRLAVDSAISTALTRLHVQSAPASTSTLTSDYVEYKASSANAAELSYRPTLLSMGRDESARHFASVRAVSAVNMATEVAKEMIDMSRTAVRRLS